MNKRFCKNYPTAKYREIISDIEEGLQYQNINAPEFSEIKQVLKESFARELEGEVIAQSWAWISKDNALVLDSWERLRDEDDKLLKSFLKESLKIF